MIIAVKWIVFLIVHVHFAVVFPTLCEDGLRCGRGTMAKTKVTQPERERKSERARDSIKFIKNY